MKILDWLGKTIRPPKSGKLDVTTYRIETAEAASNTVALDTYALFTVVGMIARLISGCEFRTFRYNEEYHGEEWASLNARPNKNQNAVEWKRELVSRLLLKGEVLCIQLNDGQRIIADAFNKEDRTLYESVFTQVSRDGFVFDDVFYSGDVIYLTTPINAKEAWIQSVMSTYESLMSSTAKRFNNADGEKGILNVNALAKGDQEFEATFDKLMNESFKGYFNAKSAVLPLFEGYTYTPNNSTHNGTYTNDTTAIKTIPDEALARAAEVFGFPASFVRGDASGIKEALSAGLTNCIKPLTKMIAAEFTAKYYTLAQIGSGNYFDVDTSNILHHDIIDSGERIFKLFGSGFSHNEILKALDQPKLKEAWADEHFVTANYETIDNALTAEGGDGYAQKNLGD